MTEAHFREFAVAAVLCSFIFTAKSNNGLIAWYKSSSGQGDFRRLCIDRLTNSATLFWQHSSQIERKTFYSAREFRDWVALHPAEPQVEVAS
jgi:hypothetical protein